MTVETEVLIVGAGFGGMGAAIELKRNGVDDILIVEREDDLGGTWHVNHYPGLAVDIPSTTYSYSFEPNPFWSRLFAPGAELKRYAAHVADKYDLKRHMRFNATVSGARFDEDAGVWDVDLADGTTVRARYLVAATGFLSQPKMPDIPGIEDFAGKVVHTAAWDDDHDLTGERVAVIGTGATAVQLIPAIAKKVAHLTVFQRTPIWVVPKMDRRISQRTQRLFARVPLTQRMARAVTTSILEVIMVTGVLHFRQGRPANRAAARLALRHLHRQVKDPELRRKLTPDYDFGCKRPTLSNSYFRAFTRPNVTLETTAIERFVADGVVTTDGRTTPIDTLVCATGFDIWDVNFPPFPVIGREGRNLGEWWRSTRFSTFEGITVPRFPNLMCLASPYSYSGLSFFTTIEYQMRHIGRVFRELRRTGTQTFEVTEPAHDAFLERVTDKLGDSVFVLGQCSTARSYYFNQHGEAALLRPTSTINAMREADRFPIDSYAFSS